mgnify:CR=1 FL=1
MIECPFCAVHTLLSGVLPHSMELFDQHRRL